LPQYLIARKSPLSILFQSPNDKITVDKHMAELNIILPEEVYTLYNWHNGTKETVNEYTLGQLWIFPFAIFVPIKRAIEGYKYFAGKDGHWQSSMFMFFEAESGEMFLVNYNQNSPTHRQILKHDTGAVSDIKLYVPIMKKNNPNSKYWDMFDWEQ
jgi:hypothetical protein